MSPASPRAFAHYQSLVVHDNETPVRVETDFDLTDAVFTWDRLTFFEQAAFGIDPRLLNALIYAHVRYTDMIGMTAIEFWEFQDEDRAAYPVFFTVECAYDIEHAAGFMVAACQVPATQALLWVCRARVQEIRSGLWPESAGVPAWAYGSVNCAGDELAGRQDQDCSGSEPYR